MKIMIMGYGRHGKDTVSDYMGAELGLRNISFSLYAAEHIVYPAFEADCRFRGMYNGPADCYEKRHVVDDKGDRRAFWYEAIKEYGRGDPARFSRKLFREYDIYCGIRNVEEFRAAREEGMFDLAIWVDASGRIPMESTASCTVTMEDADIIIDNKLGLSNLYPKVNRLCKMLGQGRL